MPPPKIPASHPRHGLKLWRSLAGLEAQIVWCFSGQALPKPNVLAKTLRPHLPATLRSRYTALPGTSPDRRQSWQLSRQALLQALTTPVEHSSNRQKTFRWVCLSHTNYSKSAAAVAIVGAAEHLDGIGVDLEHCRRRLSPRVVTRLLSNTERRLPLLPIVAWCIKEAAWKANPNRANTLLSQYRIQQCDGKRAKVVIGRRSLEVRWQTIQQRWVLALAISRRRVAANPQVV